MLQLRKDKSIFNCNLPTVPTQSHSSYLVINEQTFFINELTHYCSGKAVSCTKRPANRNCECPSLNNYVPGFFYPGNDLLLLDTHFVTALLSECCHSAMGIGDWKSAFSAVGKFQNCSVFISLTFFLISSYNNRLHDNLYCSALCIWILQFMNSFSFNKRNSKEIYDFRPSSCRYVYGYG